MQFTRSSIQTQKGAADWVTGDIYIDAVAAPKVTSPFAAALVHFTRARGRPGTRTRTARRFSSPRAWGCASARAARSRRPGRATASSSSPAAGPASGNQRGGRTRLKVVTDSHR
jgi:hypothetical protein